MTNTQRALLAGAALVAAAGFSSQASAYKVGGIELGSAGGISLQDVSAETVVTAAGQTLDGVGHITSINGGFNFADPGLELNFVYSAHVAFDDGTIIIFDVGSLNFYVNAAGTFDLGSWATMAAAQAAIGGGTDWLDLVTTTVATITPYNVAGAPATGGFFGAGTDLGGSNPNGDGRGYMSVTAGAGLANAAFDTDSLLFNGTTPYDFLFTSTFSVPAGGWPAAAWGPVQDASTFTGAFVEVPEPGSLALLGLGVLGLNAWKRKPKAVAKAAA